MRVLWSDKYLYLGYECPYTKLSTFTPTQKEERMGLWDNDVVEAFIAPDPENVKRYTEFEWAPTGESLDLKLGPACEEGLCMDGERRICSED